MKDKDEIIELWRARESSYGPVVARMRELRDIYNSDIVLPGPEIGDTDRPAVANLVQQGLDQISMRVASTMPQVTFPPMRPGIQVSEKKADVRRKAVMGWWQENRLSLKLRRRARWLTGYAQSPVMIVPDRDKGIPKWELRDPLSTYPAPNLDEDEITPPDCIFAFNRGREWLRWKFPEQFGRLAKGKGSSTFTVLEYVDDAERVLLVVGDTPDPMLPETQGTASEVLLRVSNQIDMCPVVIPRRISLDRPLGQFDGALGMYLTQAKLMSLNLLAIERGVFPETWFVYPPERRGAVITEADAKDGVVGEVQGADVKVIQPQPGVFTNPTLDRLEQAERQSGGIPAEFGGYSPTNIRTAKRGGQVLSATVDFHVQEAQQLFEESLVAENRRAIAIAKTYFGNKPKSIYITEANGSVEYTPNTHFETDAHTVSYAFAGADVAQLNVEALQLVGAGLMSGRSVMEIHPMVKDPELEHDRVVSEALEKALLGSIQAQSQDPSSPYQPEVMAKLMRYVESNQMELADAIAKIQEEAQQQQAAPPPAGAPEAQPGLSNPEAPGQPQAPGTIPPEEPSMRNLRFQLADLAQMARLSKNSGGAQPQRQ